MPLFHNMYDNGEDVNIIESAAAAFGVPLWWCSAGTGQHNVIFNPRKAKVQTATPSTKKYGELATNPSLLSVEADLVGELRDMLQRTLPDYMVPGSISLVSCWPLTEHGKLDRNALPPPARQRKLTAVRLKTVYETAVADLFAQALNLESVGPYDDFFRLGGHSLMAVRLVGKINRRFGVTLGIDALLECSTVASLAERLEGMAAT